MPQYPENQRLNYDETREAVALGHPDYRARQAAPVAQPNVDPQLLSLLQGITLLSQLSAMLSQKPGGSNLSGGAPSGNQNAPGQEGPQAPTPGASYNPGAVTASNPGSSPPSGGTGGAVAPSTPPSPASGGQPAPPPPASSPVAPTLGAPPAPPTPSTPGIPSTPATAPVGGSVLTKTILRRAEEARAKQVLTEENSKLAEARANARATRLRLRPRPTDAGGGFESEHNAARRFYDQQVTENKARGMSDEEARRVANTVTSQRFRKSALRPASNPRLAGARQGGDSRYYSESERAESARQGARKYRVGAKMRKFREPNVRAIEEGRDRQFLLDILGVEPAGTLSSTQ